MVRDFYRKTVLENGLRIVTEEVPHVKSISLGFWVGAGTRHETVEINGISHFLEHMMFKGTQKRTSRDIAEALDAVGGQLNAFTTKEFTCYYAKALDEHLDLSLDVLSDMFFNSLFSEKDIEKEKHVIEEEIKMYEDSPDELIHDLFIKSAWPKHSLGRPILGTIETIGSFDRTKITDYFNSHYIPSSIVVAVAGHIKHDEIVNKITKLFSDMKPRNVLKSETPPPIEHKVTNMRKDTGQVQICLGTPGLNQDHEDIYAMYLINNILGGGLSSRLLQEIREERGLAYSVYSYHTAFCDTGLFTVYAGCSPNKYQQAIELIIKELNKLVKEGITAKELQKGVEQIKGSLYLSLESAGSRMTRIGRTELCLGRNISPEEVIQGITSVTQDQIQQLAGRLFKPENFILSTIGPLDKPEDIQKYLG